MSIGADVADLIASSTDPRLSCSPRWPRARLGDIAEVKSGFAFGSRYFNDADGVPIVRIRDLSGAATQTLYSGPVPEGYDVCDGDILVGMDGDFKAVRWRGGPALLNQRVARIRTKAEAYRADLIEEFLPAYLELIRDNTSSVTVKHLSLGTLRDVLLPAPPLHEQEQISGAVTSASTLICEMARAIDASAAKAVFLRDKMEREQFSMAEGWEEKPLGSIGDLRAGLALGRRKSDGGKTLTRPYLRTANVQRGRLDLGEVHSMQLSPSEAAKVELMAGDVLMVEGGDRDKLGRGWVWNDEIPGCVHQNHVFRLRLTPSDRITPHFVSRFANSVGQAYFERNATQTSNLASISRRAVAALSVPVPPPGLAARLDLQAERVRRAVEDVARETKQARHLLATARRSLTAAAARGSLSTPSKLPHSLAATKVHVDPPVARAVTARERATKGKPSMTRSAMSAGKRRSLVETLRSAGEPMAPETLFTGAGFLHPDVDEFYQELQVAVEAGKIVETPERRLLLVGQPEASA